MNYKKFKILIVSFLLGLTLASAEEISKEEIRAYLSVLNQKKFLALPIGIKIWFNESDGKDSGLTCWNKDEHFASLGIGHFLWYPETRSKSDSQHSFPKLILYLKNRGVEIPEWIYRNYQFCPWQNREVFYLNFEDEKMVELRNFLKQTIQMQAEFLIDQLIETIPALLEITPVSERAYIFNNLKSLSEQPQGLYVLIDFLNFKGAGLSDYYHGTGLLQVLRKMSEAPVKNPLAAFSWSAKQALVARALDKPHLKYENWLKGWLNRVDRYYLDDSQF